MILHLLSSKYRILVVLSVLLGSSAFAQVGIGTTSPNASAALEVYSTNKALLLPRLTTAAIDSILTPVEGMMVYNSQQHKFWGFGGTTAGPVVAQTSTNVGLVMDSDTILAQSITAPYTFHPDSLTSYVACHYSNLKVVAKIRSGSGTTGPVLMTSDSAFVIANNNYPLPPFKVHFPATAPSLQKGEVYTICLQYVVLQPSLLPAGWTPFVEVPMDYNDPYAGGDVLSYYPYLLGNDLQFQLNGLRMGWRAME